MENAYKSKEIETENGTDKEQSANNKLSTHEQSVSTEDIGQKESSEKKLEKKRKTKITVKIKV